MLCYRLVKFIYLQVPLHLEPLQACEVSDKRLWIGNLDTRVNEYVPFYIVKSFYIMSINGVQWLVLRFYMVSSSLEVPGFDSRPGLCRK